jgi:hypothetical protein
VFVVVTDPVGQEFVASLARPPQTCDCVLRELHIRKPQPERE